MDQCEDHGAKFAPKMHPDFGKKGTKMLDDHSDRGASHPKHHTKGKMPSQMNPDHGPHK